MGVVALLSGKNKEEEKGKRESVVKTKRADYPPLFSPLSLLLRLSPSSPSSLNAHTHTLCFSLSLSLSLSLSFFSILTVVPLKNEDDMKMTSVPLINNHLSLTIPLCSLSLSLSISLFSPLTVKRDCGTF